MSPNASELGLAKQLMLQLVNAASGTVKIPNLAALEKLLSGLGFHKVSAVEYGPTGGQQLFYQNGRVVVRLKTKGDKAGFRANQPQGLAQFCRGPTVHSTQNSAKLRFDFSKGSFFDPRK